MAAAKKKKNRAWKDRHHCAKQHLIATQKKEVPEGKIIQGRTKEQKIYAWKKYKKEIKRAKQQRRRRQAINRQIWQELCSGLPKMPEEATSSTQPANPVRDISAHLTDTDSKECKKADQH